MRFRTTILQSGKTATGIQVPDEVMAALGPSRRPPIRVTLNGYTYRTTVGSVDGRPMFGVSAHVRRNAKSAYVLWIESAKKAETRKRRILEAVRMLKEGRKQR